LASLMSNIVSGKWSEFELSYTNIFWYICFIKLDKNLWANRIQMDICMNLMWFYRNLRTPPKDECRKLRIPSGSNF